MQIYDHNHAFFNQPTPINAYWAGFLAADGSIYRNPNYNKSCRLNCTLKDEDHVLKLRDILGASNPVKKYEKNIDHKNHTYYHLNIDRAEQLARDLEINFNITERKSLSLKPPPLQEEKCIGSFIRGYFDGDGSIYRNKNSGFQISFLGTESMILWIKNQLNLYVLQNIGGSVDAVKSIKRLRFTGQRKPSLILTWLYAESCDETRLERKYNRFLEYSTIAGVLPKIT